MSIKNRLLHLKHNGSLTENDCNRLIESLEAEQEIKDLIEDYKDLSDILVKHKKAIKILKEKPFILEIGLDNFYLSTYGDEEVYEYVEEDFCVDMYGDSSVMTNVYQIPKEEYILLKEVLVNE